MIVLNTRYATENVRSTLVVAKSPIVTPIAPPAWLGAQPGHHRPRQVDAVDRHAAGCQRQGDAPRPDAQFQRPATAGQPGQDIDGRVHHARLEHLRRLFVVGRRYPFSEVAILIVHRRTVPQNAPACARGFSRGRGRNCGTGQLGVFRS